MQYHFKTGIDFLSVVLRNHWTQKGVGFFLLSFSFLACEKEGSSSQERDWVLVWEDEFEGPAGQLPDSTKWNFDIGIDWGNNQLEFDTDRPENVSIDGNGNLAITARKEAYAGSAYTSGRITTKGKFDPVYGRFEARMKMPSGAGIWPAFWLLGSNIDEVSWPQCGEIDIMEYRGQEPSKIHGSIHGPGYFGGGALSTTFNLTGDRFDTGFHTFVVEWGDEGIWFYVDNVLYQIFRLEDAPGDWVYDHPFHMILNVAVGGDFVGSPNSQTSFPQTMLVDWIRIYSEQI